MNIQVPVNDAGTALQAEQLEAQQATQVVNEQRRESRVDYRTTGVAYHLGEIGLAPESDPIRIWTVDVSATGCLIKSKEKLSSKRVLIKLLLPQLNESILEARIVRELQDHSVSMNGKGLESHLYGIKFTEILKEADLGFELPEAPQVTESEKLKIDSSEDIPDSMLAHSGNGGFDRKVMTVGGLTVVAILAILLAAFL